MNKPHLTSFATEIADRQYFHKNPDGTAKEDYDGMLRRVARHIARAEAIDAFKADTGRYPEWYISYDGRRKNLLNLEAFDAWVKDSGYTDLVAEWEERFYTLLVSQRFSPGGRILAGAGSNYGQMMNCFVTAPNGRYISKAKLDPDSIDGIYELSYKLAKITKTGGGTGIPLSFMRESGAYVSGSGGRSSGPVSFLRLNFNPTLRVVRLEGVRRGAGMATLRMDHPDVLDFVTAKDHDREAVEGKIEAFNISLLVTDEFMDNVRTDGVHYCYSVVDGAIKLPSPVPGKYHLPGEVPTSVTGNPKDPATSKEIPVRDGGVPARWLWNEIVTHAWETGDPGVLFIDTINRYWPMLEALGPLEATNPCGEEPLWPGESCCLGSMILDRYVVDGRFLTEEFINDVKIATRFLDNVITMNVHPLEDTQEWCDRLRRIGLGVMGDAVAMLKLGYGYASKEAHEARRQIAGLMRNVSTRASEELALDKGAFPLSNLVPHLTPRRNVHTLSIAPTGTISMINDTSSGIEPIYALVMLRRVGDDYKFRMDPTFERYIREQTTIDLDDETLFVSYSVPSGNDAKGRTVYSTVMLPPIVRDILKNNGSIHGLAEFTPHAQAMFQTAHDVTPSQHVDVQATWQTALDGPELAMASISKTVNMPNTSSVEDVKRVYERGHDRGLKGITIYRDGSRTDQVLRTDTDEPQATPEVVSAPITPETPQGPFIVERPRLTTGGMMKVAFRDANGNERKVYVYLGTDDLKYPVEVFIIDEDAGPEVHPYAAALGKVISQALKYGTPPAKIAKKLVGLTGGSVSFSGGVYQSVPDLVGKLLTAAVDEMEREFEDDDDDADAMEETTLLEDISVPVKHCNRGSNCPLVSQGGCLVCSQCGYSKCG